MVPLLEYHTMAPQKDTETFEWAYLIRPDKSPSPQLEQLCLGIANLIVIIKPKTPSLQLDYSLIHTSQSKLKTSNPSNGLTPEKLAAFYRTVGGNYDSLFLSTPNSSLSFIYQSLGCFHVLQPSSNPFEPPSTPALLPHGFIRWQTIQLLLCPGEHSSFLKEAVKYFDVVNPSTGATFPKDIPRHVFPSEPDAEMVKWHDTLSKRLELEYEASRVRKDPAAQHPRGAEKPPNPEPSRPPSSVNDSSKPQPQPQNENDYFSYATRATRPGVFSRMQSHEAYSPFTQPVPRGEPLDDHDPPELDADTARTFRHVGPNRDPPRTSTSSRQSRTRERSRTPSRHRHSSRRRGHRSRNRNRVESSDSSVSSGDDDDDDDDDEEDEVEDERYTRSSRRRQRPVSTSRRSNSPKPISRSADGRRLRGLHSRLLSSERSEGRRRHSHDAPLSRSHRSGTTSRICSGSPYRRAPPPPHPLSNLHQTIQVEIVPSDTELDTATDTDLDRGHGHGYDGTEDELEYEHGHGRGRERERERELDGDDDDDDDSPSEHHYTPETKRARDFYYTGVHHIPKSKSKSKSTKSKPSRRRPEYIVLPAGSSSSNNTSPSTITSPSTSTSTAAATAGTSPIRATTTTRTTTPSKPIKYKEYILIEPDSPVSAPPPTFTAPTYATHTHARMMPSSHSRYVSTNTGGGAMHTPIPITTQAPSLSRKSSRSGGRWASHDPSRSGSGGGLHPRYG